MENGGHGALTLTAMWHVERAREVEPGSVTIHLPEMVGISALGMNLRSPSVLNHHVITVRTTTHNPNGLDVDLILQQITFIQICALCCSHCETNLHSLEADIVSSKSAKSADLLTSGVSFLC